jgi:two-component system, OmpR family, sensor kinase
VDSLVRDAHQLTDILDDLLLAADPRQTNEAVDLAAIVNDAVGSARPLADERGVTLTTAVTPLSVQGGRASLRRAVTALLDNAIRHARGSVTVTVGTVGGQATVDVADDGPGLDPDVVPHLFARFTPPPADGVRGVHRRYGLGLALVSEIAARHGGAITVLDTRRGATFRLTPPTTSTRSDAGSGPS